ncbi:MAG: CAP domain-containing protein, partial [Rhodomicrobium sp.]
MPSKAAATPSSSQTSSSGGIWTNFSSAFSSGDQPAQASQKSGDDMAPGLDPNEALDLVNEYRSSKGLPALSLESRATAAAAILAKDMANHDQMSHLGPNGADLQKRLTMSGYRFKVAAENVSV